MKIKKINFALILLGAMFLVSLASVSALGVTRPLPYDLELLKGETGTFSFEIQVLASEGDMTCEYSFNGLDNFGISFQKPILEIDSGSSANVYGTVTVPENTALGEYSGTLSVSCGPAGNDKGSTVKTTISGSPFNIKVVETREEPLEEMIIPEEKEYPSSTLIIVIVLTVIAIIIYYIYRTKAWKKYLKFLKK